MNATSRALVALAQLHNDGDTDYDTIRTILDGLVPDVISNRALALFLDLAAAVERRDDLVAGVTDWASTFPELTGFDRDEAALDLAEAQIDEALDGFALAQPEVVFTDGGAL